MASRETKDWVKSSICLKGSSDREKKTEDRGIVKSSLAVDALCGNAVDRCDLLKWEHQSQEEKKRRAYKKRSTILSVVSSPQIAIVIDSKDRDEESPGQLALKGRQAVPEGKEIRNDSPWEKQTCKRKKPRIHPLGMGHASDWGPSKHRLAKAKRKV